MNPLTALKAAFRRLAEPSKPDLIIHRTIGTDDEPEPGLKYLTGVTPQDPETQAFHAARRLILESSNQQPKTPCSAST